MAFDPNGHLRNLKGQQYLDVKWRLVWLREEYPQARIKTEMVHLDLDHKLAVFRAEVEIPERGLATGYGSETERDFPAGFIEKAETKAIGRALAALGFGTQFALELDEGDRVVDSPVTPMPNRPAVVKSAAVSGTGRSDRGSLKVVAERGADDQAETLRSEVVAGLAADREAASKLPKAADDMTSEELEKTLSWLRTRAKRQA